jgi:purine-binding chemotaxis protein CheW
MLTYITFTLENGAFALPSGAIQEVLRAKDYAIYTLPKAPEYCIGLINLRGEIIPIVDLYSFFRSTKSLQKNKGNLLVAHTTHGILGFRVDTVNQHKTILESELTAPPIGSIEHDECIRGIVYSSDSPIMILDLEILLKRRLIP